eukprot:3922976-Amphidinium_carterae.1
MSYEMVMHVLRGALALHPLGEENGGIGGAPGRGVLCHPGGATEESRERGEAVLCDPGGEQGEENSEPLGVDGTLVSLEGEEDEQTGGQEVLHEPYRSWCRICVAARGLNERHEKQEHKEDGVITIGMDYGYLLDGAETDCSMPLWCAKDTRRWNYGAVVPTTGVEHPYNVQEVKRQILAGGFTKVILRSDGVPQRRLLESQKVAAETVKGVRGVPWKPDGDLEEEWTKLR